MALKKQGSKVQITKKAYTATEAISPRTQDFKITDVVSKVDPEFLFYTAKAISSLEPHLTFNGNGDGFPKEELKKAYKSFESRGIYLNHDSDSLLKSVGTILSAEYLEDPETGEAEVQILGRIDRKLHPEIARMIETGALNSTSMGCSCDESVCSICGTTLHSDADEKCEHLSALGINKKYIAELDMPEYGIVKGAETVAGSINKGITFNEDSLVNVPADPTAKVSAILARNMRSKLSKKAALTKEEQLDLVAQMETLMNQFDEPTKNELKAEFCGCPVKESPMSEKNAEDTKQILSKISAYELEQLESYISFKSKKANEVANKEIVADASKKEETFLNKVMDKVKNSFAAKMLEKKVEKVAAEEMKKDEGKVLVAKFTEQPNIMDSTWALYDGDKIVLDATLKDIWGSKFETLPFKHQRFATSEAYGKEIVARYTKDGLEKLADLWDVSHKLSKKADGPELGPDGKRVTPSTGSSNKKHDYPTNPKFEKPGQESGQKGPAAPAHEDVKTTTKIDMPGQEKGQKGPAAPKAKEVKTDYSEPKPEAEGKEVKTTPKNPEEKKHEKSSDAVETSYVAKGDEAKKEEEGKDKKEDKKASLIVWSSLTPKAQEFIKTAAKTYVASGMKQAEAVAKAHSEFAAQEIDMNKKAAEKPVESVDGSTLPEGTKKFDAKPDEAVDGTTLPGGAAPTSAPETSAQGDKEHKTPDLTKKPTESVDGTTLPPQGKKDEESVEKTTHPDGKKEMGDKSDSAVKAASKTAATEMPDEMKMEDKPLEGPSADPTEAPSAAAPATPVDAPAEAVSAFDKVDSKLDIGDGYSAVKDPASKEIIVSKDGKEVKRLPDGFGADPAVVLKLMKAVLGLPSEEAKAPAKDMPFTPEEAKPEAVAPEEAKPEAHEDPMAMKESALKAREAAVQQKEAELKAIEVKAEEEAKAKKFATLVQARSERCKKIIEAMVEKDALTYDNDIYEAALLDEKPLLTARNEAMEFSINAKMKQLIAMNDSALAAVEKTISDIKAPVSGNTKKASWLSVSPIFNAELSEDQELAKIFSTMGDPKKRPQ